MDLHDLWQEHKRWILGVAIGLVVLLVGRAVIRSTYDTTAEERKITANVRYVQEEQRFDADALQAAKKEAAEIGATVERLRAALIFRPREDFVLEGKGDPGLHFDKVNREVRSRLLTLADQAGVELQAKDLQWPAAVGRGEIEETLIGLCVLQEAMERLLAAHDQARAASVEAAGLVAIDGLKVIGRGAGPNVTRRRRPVAEDGAAVEEVAVELRMRADAAVVQLFLEACRSDAARPIALRDFKMQVGGSPGEPLIVQGTLLALRIGAS
jgi:hypothetical protein